MSDNRMSHPIHSLSVSVSFILLVTAVDDADNVIHPASVLSFSTPPFLFSYPRKCFSLQLYVRQKVKNRVSLEKQELYLQLSWKHAAHHHYARWGFSSCVIADLITSGKIENGFQLCMNRKLSDLWKVMDGFCTKEGNVNSNANCIHSHQMVEIKAINAANI